MIVTLMSISVNGLDTRFYIDPELLVYHIQSLQGNCQHDNDQCQPFITSALSFASTFPKLSIQSLMAINNMCVLEVMMAITGYVWQGEQ